TIIVKRPHRYASPLDVDPDYEVENLFELKNLLERLLV
ncbi:HAD family hydrolase, partial [Candidatus Micrarchaeota archaeon]|nr:HAD family hydrolase [Candidatus Micrarchaeota archaeon]